MNFLPTEIKLEAVVPRARDTVLNAVGNSFAVHPPWGGVMPRIVEQKRDGFSFSLEGFTPFAFMADYGELLVAEEGRKSRVFLSLNMRGSLLMLYLAHWLAIAALFLVHFAILPLFVDQPAVLGFVLAAFLLLCWPFLLFEALKLRQRRRLETFLGNLIYYV